MKQPAKSVYIATVTVFATLLLFQNCGDPLGGGDKQTSLSDTLPFAYDTTIDTIAYMSCAGGTSSANRQAIWTIRAGAFGAGSGIKLTQAFLDVTSNFSPDQRAAALAESTRNANAVAQLAIRQAFGYQSHYSSGGSAMGEDFSPLTGSLADGGIASTLGKTNPVVPVRFNYFPGIYGLNNRRIEGNLRFTASEGEAQGVRGVLNTSGAVAGILAVTYPLDGASDTSARAPTGAPANNKVYGRGYQLSLISASANESEPRILSSINEINLETGNGSGGIDIRPWVCGQDMRFRIARDCTTCGCSTDPAPTDRLARIRAVLLPEHWYVDLTNMCVKQKEVAQQCYPTNVSGDYNYVSICTRQ